MREAGFRIDFLRKLQRLLDEGDFSATYKFALLRALADLAVEVGPDPDGRLDLTLGQLAEKLIDYYWRQARPYRAGVLHQNSGPQGLVVTEILKAQELAATPAELRAYPFAWARLRRIVARNIRDMPLRRLQRLPTGIVDFLYEQPQEGSGGVAPEDFRIRLRPGVPDALCEFHPFVLALIELGWVRQLAVIRANQGQLGSVTELGEFLFGSERRSLRDYLAIFRELQRGRCFYCERSPRTRLVLDHFVAWSRYPADLGHNFVAACAECNGRKSDHLPAVEWLQRWHVQNFDGGQDLEVQFQARSLPHDRLRSLRIAAWAYEHAERTGSSTWKRGREFEALTPAWQQALGLFTRELPESVADWRRVAESQPPYSSGD